MRLFDTHAHYDDEAFDADREALLTALPESGVEAVVNPGITVETSRKALALAERYPHVWAAVGIHPEDCAGAGEADLEAIWALAAHPKVRGHRGDRPGLLLAGKPAPGISAGDLPRGRWPWRRSWTCPSSSTTGRPTGTALPSSRNFPGVRGVFHCYSGSAGDGKGAPQTGLVPGL